MEFDEIIKAAKERQEFLNSEQETVEYCIKKAEIMRKRANVTLNPRLRKQYKSWYHFYMCRAMGIQKERN